VYLAAHSESTLSEARRARLRRRRWPRGSDWLGRRSTTICNALRGARGWCGLSRNASGRADRTDCYVGDTAASYISFSPSALEPRSRLIESWKLTACTAASDRPWGRTGSCREVDDLGFRGVRQEGRQTLAPWSRWIRVRCRRGRTGSWGGLSATWASPMSSQLNFVSGSIDDEGVRPARAAGGRAAQGSPRRPPPPGWIVAPSAAESDSRSHHDVKKETSDASVQVRSRGSVDAGGSLAGHRRRGAGYVSSVVGGPT